MSHNTESDPIKQQFTEFIILLRRFMDVTSDLTFYPSHKERLISLKSDLWKYWHSLSDLKNAWKDPYINEDLDFIISGFMHLYDNVKQLIKKKNLYTLNDNGLINSIQIENAHTARIFLLEKRQEIEKRIKKITLNSLQESYIARLKIIYLESHASLERYRIDYCNGVHRLYRGLSSYDIERERFRKMLSMVLTTLREDCTDYDKNIEPIYKSWNYQNVEMVKEIEWFKENFEKMTLSDFIKDEQDCHRLLREIYRSFCEFFEKRYNKKVETNALVELD